MRLILRAIFFLLFSLNVTETHGEVLCFYGKRNARVDENREPRSLQFFSLHYWMVMESYDCDLWAALHFGDSEISILWLCGLSPTTGNGLRSAPPLPSSCDRIWQRKRQINKDTLFQWALEIALLQSSLPKDCTNSV